MADNKPEVTEKPTEPESKADDNQSKAKYRYSCEACTGIAYYTDASGGGHPQPNCNNCGKPLSYFKKENLIALTDNEREQLAALK